VHRDIKPSSIFLESSGRVCILDFGMARVDSSTLTQAGSVLGTLNYMAPEQVQGRPCTPASDVFSAAVVFFELAGGRHPFAPPGATTPAILQAIVFEKPPDLKQLAAGMPEGLDLVLHKALEKEPAQRFENAADFKQALSLSRITLKLRGPQAAPGGSPQGEAADLGKTVVMQKPGVPPRSAPPPPSAPASPPPDVVFCLSCTQPNPRGEATCSSCGLPLGFPQPPPPAPPRRKTQWAIMAAAAAAAGVMIALYGLFQYIASR
jgi:serine/threonine-protein kinase